MKKTILAAAALLVLPGAAQAQLFPSSSAGLAVPGFYIGAQGGLNWLLNNSSYQMDTGWAAGGVIGYDFVGPRVELEGMYRSNDGSGNVFFPGGVARVRGGIDQVSVMANLLYDFFPGETITPYVGAGAGIAFIDRTIQGCNLCSTQFAYQGIIGVGWNIDQNFRVNLDGRYFGTTSPGPYNNNNITAMLGGVVVSSESVRSRIRHLVSGENARQPLSDDRIVDLLKGEGIEIARRTVAKYREAMRIPSSAERRRLGRLGMNRPLPSVVPSAVIASQAMIGPAD